SYAIERSCRMKADVVAQDEFDRTGLRASLNLGHTVGHAVESLGGYRLYRHGEAVAIGMVAATLLSERLGVAEEPISGRTVQILEAVGLPTKPKRPLDPDALLAAMLRDKKTTEGTLNFVLPRRIGEVVNRPVPAEVVLDVVASQGVSGTRLERKG
ncbi:MAG: 3-dehydroquinate synthase, partial [Armatimonadetes bacterium]|nr:3-dehydroquinate synthase [Armatimonadota bacterium]